MRAWIGLAMLSASWLLGVGIFGPADFRAWIGLVALGTMLLLWARCEEAGLAFVGRTAGTNPDLCGRRRR